MGGEGSMSHMITTLKLNRALRRSKRRKFRNQKSINTSTITKKWKDIEISNSELQKIKEDIKEKVLKEKRLYNVITLILVTFFISLVYHYRAYL